MAGASLTTLAHFEVLLRNRIAHHDSLLDQNLGRRLREMVNIANVIDPTCGEWLATHTEITALLDCRPIGE